MKILAYIPARSGSQGIKNKNMAILKKKPLIYYTLNIAKKITKDVYPFVSTDSKKIGMVAKKYGAQVPFLRPKVYAKDKSTDYEVFNHFIKWWDKKRKDKIKFIVQIRPTTPYRDPSGESTRDAIMKRRNIEQNKSKLKSTSLWKKQWSHTKG